MHPQVPKLILNPRSLGTYPGGWRHSVFAASSPCCVCTPHHLSAALLRTPPLGSVQGCGGALGSNKYMYLGPMSLNLALCQPPRCALPPAAWSQHLLCCLSFIAGLQTTTYHDFGSLPSPPALCSVPLLANTAPPTSAVPLLVSTWSSGAPALIPVDHLPPISSFSRFPAGLPLLAPTQAGLILSPAVEPVPHKACSAHSVRTICRNAGLLGVNIALLQQLDSVQGPLQSFSVGPKPLLREITSLSSGCIVFWPIRPSGQLIRPLVTN